MNLSFSQIATWSTCQRQYLYSYIYSYEPQKTSDAANRGIRIHKFISDGLELFKQGVSRPGLPDALRNTVDPTSLDSIQAYAAAGAYLTQHPFSLIEETEQEHSVPILGVPFTYIVDAIGFINGSRRIVDFKTASQSWWERQRTRFIQTKLYSLLHKERTGEDIPKSRIEFILLHKKSTDFEHEDYTFTNLEASALKRDLHTYIEEITEFKNAAEREGLPVIAQRAKRTYNLNACKFCPFAEPCQMDSEGRLTNLYWKTTFKKKEGRVS